MKRKSAPIVQKPLRPRPRYAAIADTVSNGLRRIEVALENRTAPPLFVYTIAADQDRPSEGDGFVRAETIHEAVALVGHREVNV